MSDRRTTLKREESVATFDYVVVGTGAAGSIVASRLAEDGASTVCALEAGPSDWRPEIHVPAGVLRTLHDPTLTWQFTTEAGRHLNNRVVRLPQGRTLGGTTSINGMFYNRGQPADYDRWRQLGNRGWSYAELLPYFKRTERRVGFGEEPYRGRCGSLPVTDVDLHHPLADAFISGAPELGIPFNPDYNGACAEGVSYSQRTIEKGRRISTAQAFLKPARSRFNLRVITNAQACSIVFEGNSAVGVSYLRKDGAERRIRARREVILSCGSVNTPKLLMLSGIGPAKLLQSLGIRVLADLPGVGANFRDHFLVQVTARTKGIATINQRTRGLGLLSELTRWIVGRPSILTAGPYPVYFSWRSHPSVPHADIGGFFSAFSFQEGRAGEFQRAGGMSCPLFQHRPSSVGYVKIRSTDPREDPIIQPNYLAEDVDCNTIVAGIRLVRALMRTRTLAPYFDTEVSPGAEFESDAALLDFVRQNGSSGYHPIGTAKMGPAEDAGAVVDDNLRVRGIHGLRVADASVMPDMPSANTAAACMAIGEKAADLILGRSPLSVAQV